MLRKLGQELNTDGVRTTFAEAKFPAPFAEGLEFSSPVRGTWNIVHTGFLIPEAHEIFVCARGCLRGVVLTAAEANALHRYSAIEICEENILDGSMEELMIEGVADVLQKLPYRPRAVLLYISCQHFFMAYDQAHVFSELRARFPDIRFADCYMIPTLRKSGITPDQKMRIQLYSMLEPREGKAQTLHSQTGGSRKNGTSAELPSSEEISPNQPLSKARVPENETEQPGLCPEGKAGLTRVLRMINHIGSNLPIHQSSELLPWLSANGICLRSLHDCRTFDEYLSMSEASANIYYEPLAAMAAKDLERRLGQEAIYLPFVFDREGLRENYRRLAEKLSIPIPDTRPLEEGAEQALRQAKDRIGDTPIAVDYTFTFRILNFTRMLLAHGFCVTDVYADSFLPEEENDFLWIRGHFPDIAIWATNRPKMRFADRGRTADISEQRAADAAAAPVQNDPAVSAAATAPVQKFSAVSDAAAAPVQKYEAVSDAAAPLWEEESSSASGISEAALRENRLRASAPGITGPRLLAIGQKAAWFTGTEHFVNVAESGGYYGFGGIREIARLMEEAFAEKKDPRDLIQRKGYGCESCI